MRRTAVVALAAAAVTALSAPSYADGGVQHLAFSFDEDPVVTQVDGIGAGCPGFTGTLEEDRHLEIAGIMKADGTGHATTDVTATVALTPSDPAAASYSGDYTQHQTGFFVDDGHGDRVVTTTTHGTLTGSDGSAWRISEVVHFSVDASGTVRAWFDRMRCTP
ncbi:MAG TPA: hypothetical protein VFM09_11335 [Marmoricola sp.]|nr:hypothetical protein [Marmoricola sp.]